MMIKTSIKYKCLNKIRILKWTLNKRIYTYVYMNNLQEDIHMQ